MTTGQIIVLSACAVYTFTSALASTSSPPCHRQRQAALAPQTDRVRLHNRSWALFSAVNVHGQRLSQLFVQNGQPLTLYFSPDTIFVNNACRPMQGRYSHQELTLQIGRIVPQRLNCTSLTHLAQERAASRLIIGVFHYAIFQQGSDTLLRLSGQDGTRLSFVARSFSVCSSCTTRMTPHPEIVIKPSLPGQTFQSAYGVR